MPHCILLVQANKSLASRTYSDYENVKEAMTGVCQMYEAHLREVYPTKTHIHYEVADLFSFIDALADLSCLVLQPDTLNYKPHDKEWIKAKVYMTLKSMTQ
ncbi:hypothetical protein PTSG_10107 [Salpingoeca rosetta]|uniref:Enhancer of rudimentary homolog n=1 Tax=Salpingoeca rosetta (strain ATCC 50818 / BSB-021) TaxID=946362 RepID=F2UPI2_SALR5|nr:uncharacterized protein PTSG_10107 [Salpingoeca rosetta]EGD79537.1 hypothetical protein PTSG_10107 [Salpingoeca rosetta]|eukprot:XP_004989018.1 hypothetical protein PTSG_10107 [Salpingoeca rosetta]